jgi:hypothetical protein
VAETEQIMEVNCFWLEAKNSINQFNSIEEFKQPKYNALSVDHLEVMKRKILSP